MTRHERCRLERGDNDNVALHAMPRTAYQPEAALSVCLYIEDCVSDSPVSAAS